MPRRGDSGMDEFMYEDGPDLDGISQYRAHEDLIGPIL
jgi:hypothetical protein